MDDSRALSAYNAMIHVDLKILWLIQDICFSFSLIDNFLNKLVSKNPLQDIVFSVAPLFIIGVVDIGASHFWLVLGNLVIVYGKTLGCFIYKKS